MGGGRDEVDKFEKLIQRIFSINYWMRLCLQPQNKIKIIILWNLLGNEDYVMPEKVFLQMLLLLPIGMKTNCVHNESFHLPPQSLHAKLLITPECLQPGGTVSGNYIKIYSYLGGELAFSKHSLRYHNTLNPKIIIFKINWSQERQEN